MFHRALKIYTVHVKPGGRDPYARAVFVREGFNPWAFFLGAFWCLYHRLWLPALSLMLANGCLMALEERHMFANASLLALQLAVQTVTGFEGNDWRRKKLAKRGYALTDIVTGDSLLRAEQRYFERVLSMA